MYRLQTQTQMNNNEIVEKIQSIRQNVRNQESNTFFPSSNKEKQYQAVQQQIQFDQLLHASVHLVKENIIFVDFSILKVFANASNYEFIVDSLIAIMNTVVAQYNTIQFHLNCNTISVTSCQRLKPIIQLFSEKSAMYNKNFSDKTENIYIYYTPSVISTMIQMLKPFISPVLHNKYILYQKDESPIRLQQLYS